MPKSKSSRKASKSAATSSTSSQAATKSPESSPNSTRSSRTSDMSESGRSSAPSLDQDFRFPDPSDAAGSADASDKGEGFDSNQAGTQSIHSLASTASSSAVPGLRPAERTPGVTRSDTAASSSSRHTARPSDVSTASLGTDFEDLVPLERQKPSESTDNGEEGEQSKDKGRAPVEKAASEPPSSLQTPTQELLADDDVTKLIQRFARPRRIHPQEVVQGTQKASHPKTLSSDIPGQSNPKYEGDSDAESDSDERSQDDASRPPAQRLVRRVRPTSRNIDIIEEPRPATPIPTLSPEQLAQVRREAGSSAAVRRAPPVSNTGPGQGALHRTKSTSAGLSTYGQGQALVLESHPISGMRREAPVDMEALRMTPLVQRDARTTTLASEAPGQAGPSRPIPTAAYCRPAEQPNAIPSRTLSSRTVTSRARPRARTTKITTSAANTRAPPQNSAPSSDSSSDDSAPAAPSTPDPSRPRAATSTAAGPAQRSDSEPLIVGALSPDSSPSPPQQRQRRARNPSTGVEDLLRRPRRGETCSLCADDRVITLRCAHCVGQAGTRQVHCEACDRTGFRDGAVCGVCSGARMVNAGGCRWCQGGERRVRCWVCGPR